jgi:predicted transcriptional regulator
MPQKVTVYLDDDVHAKLKAVAKSIPGATMSDIANMALRINLKKQLKKK